MQLQSVQFTKLNITKKKASHRTGVSQKFLQLGNITEYENTFSLDKTKVKALKITKLKKEASLNWGS